MGTTKEEVIKSLASQLYTTKVKPSIPQEDFVERVTTREQEESTCLSKGLMIPHAILESDEGEEITGILGISSEGLDLDAPDGRPVHAILLLATPKSDRKRHLEVLAAFASAITRDENLAEQLSTPAAPHTPTMFSMLMKPRISTTSLMTLWNGRALRKTTE